MKNLSPVFLSPTLMSRHCPRSKYLLSLTTAHCRALPSSSVILLIDSSWQSSVRVSDDSTQVKLQRMVEVRVFQAKERCWIKDRWVCLKFRMLENEQGSVNVIFSMIKRVPQPLIVSDQEVRPGLLLKRVLPQPSPKSFLQIFQGSSASGLFTQNKERQANIFDRGSPSLFSQQLSSSPPIKIFFRKPLFGQGAIRVQEREEQKKMEGDQAMSGLLIGFLNAKDKKQEKTAIRDFISCHKSKLQAQLKALPKDPQLFKSQLKDTQQQLSQLLQFMSPLQSLSQLHDEALASQITDFYNETKQKAELIERRLQGDGGDKRVIELAIQVDVLRKQGIIVSAAQVERVRRRVEAARGRMSKIDYEECMKYLTD